jgi:hypothetical protein
MKSKYLDWEELKARVRMARAAVWRACGVIVWAGVGSDGVLGEDGLMAVQLLLPLPLLLLLLLLLLTVRESQLPAPAAPLAAAAVLSIVCAALVATAAASLASNRSSICCNRCLARLRCRGAEGRGIEEEGWSLRAANCEVQCSAVDGMDSIQSTVQR